MKTYTAISILLLFTLISCAGKNVQTDNETDATVIVSEVTGSVRTDEYLYIGGRRYDHKLNELDGLTRFRVFLHPYDENQSNSLEGIESLQNINTLTITTENTWVDISEIDFSPLNSLNNLKILRLVYTTFNEIPDFSRIPSLERIWTYDCVIMSLNGIEKANQIKGLSISFKNNYFGSFEPLSELTNLEGMGISGSSYVSEEREKTSIRIADFSGLTKLKNLGISSIKNIDLTGIQNLHNLEHFTIGEHGSNVANIEAIAGLTKLKEISIGINSMPSLDFLGALQNLYLLYIYGNDPYSVHVNTVDVTPLQNLSSLEHLLLRCFTIKNFHILDNMPKLRSVDVVDSKFDPADNNTLQNAYVAYQNER